MLASANSLRASISRAVGVNNRTAVAAMGAVRNLDVHEYISMEIMHANRIPTPKAYVAKTPEEADDIYNQKLAGREFFQKELFLSIGFVLSLLMLLLWILASSVLPFHG